MRHGFRRQHALVYTSYRQMALAHGLADDAPWTEVPVGTLFEKWPPDVDAWLNGGGELGFPRPDGHLHGRGPCGRSGGR